MKLIHLFENEDDQAFFFGDQPQDEFGRFVPDDDKFVQTKPNEVRNPKFTLRRINRLKKIRATKNLEQLKREELLSAMYGQGSGEEGGGMGI